MGDVDRRTLLKWLGAGAAGLGATGVGGGVLDGVAGAAQGPLPAEVLRTRLTEAYGITYPIVQAGMAFYATPALAAAVTN
ncbi:MAG TPA: nitronate monooxygenase, partial [Acidimicrobiia bacterium]|nr:nitronate monooxygenase [Acidimicrobiia bacterium]